MTYMVCCVTIAQIVSHESSVPQRHPKPPAHHPSEAWDPNFLENKDARLSAARLTFLTAQEQ